MPAMGERTIADYNEYLTGQGLGPDTRRNYRRWVRDAESWLQEHHHALLAWATPTQLNDYAETIPYTHSSRGQAVAALRHYWEWKERDRPPVKAIRVPPAPEMVCRAVEPDQARDLVKVALGWWPEGTAVLFGLYLALRRTEIATAEWDRFTDDFGWYRVTGKYGKTATLPVHATLRAELAGGGTGWVFPGRFAGHVSPATIWDWSKKVATAAGIESFTTHQLRHTSLATANDMLGDLRAVQTFGRHSKPSTTAGYTRTTRTRLREVSDSLNYLD